MRNQDDKSTNKRKFGYCRVSTDEQTVENQIVELKKNGIAPAEIYPDEGVSGTVSPLKRKGFKQVYDAIMRGEVSELYVFEISRLGRNMNESLQIFLEIEQHGTKIISLSPNESWTKTQSNSERILLASMFAWFADMERKAISERSKLAIRRARDAGKHIGRPFNETLMKDSGKREYSKLKGKGLKTAQIARIMQIPQATLYRYVEKWDDEERIRRNEVA
jgi:DNA invertase Pin-like site-specific DNA recombinase